MSTLFETGTRKDAILSDCGRYRYRLTRAWGEGRPVNFVMLNPSTADANVDDPTIRRCVGFARDWGHGGIVVTNLFAFRSTNPKMLASAADPIGAFNDLHIAAAAQEADLVVCAWGSHAYAGGRGREVLRKLRDMGAIPHALRLTAVGHPSHPLYLPADLKPIPIP